MDTDTVLCLDTNILMNLFEPGRYDAKTFNKFLTAVLTGKSHLLLVDQVLVEWKRHVHNSEKDFVGKNIINIDKYIDLMKYTDREEERLEIKNTLDKIKRMQARKYRYNYGKRANRIDQLLNDPKYTKILKRTQKAEEIIVQKSINKEAPFFYNEYSHSNNTVKNESADAAIFFTLYDNLKNSTLKYKNIYFVTDNKKDFSDPANPSVIHDNLKDYFKEVNVTFSNNIKGLVNSLIPADTDVLTFFEEEGSLNEFLVDAYFTNCPKCSEEVHVNADSFPSKGAPHEQTHWLKCENCNHEWDTGDLVNDFY